MSKELSYNTVASFYFVNKEGYIYEFFGVAPKIYRTYTNWKKAIKRLFDINIEE